MTPPIQARPYSRSIFFVIALVVLAATATLVSPLEPLPAGPAGWPPDPSLLRYPEGIRVPQDPIRQQAWVHGHAGLREFLRLRPGWRATLDPSAGGLDRAVGDGIEIDLPDDGSDALEAGARAFLARHRGLLAAGIPVEAGRDAAGMELMFDQEASRPLAVPGARLVRMSLQKDGLPVLGAGISLGMRDGRVVLISTVALHPAAGSSNPRVTAEEALEAVAAYLAPSDPDRLALRSAQEPALAFYPRLETRGASDALAHHLVWILRVNPEAEHPLLAHIAYVDARDARVLALFPEAQSVGTCEADPAEARAAVSGGVRPNGALDAEVIVNFPFVRVNVDGIPVTADLNGRYPYTGGTVSCALQGEAFEMHCAQCAQPSQPLSPDPIAPPVESGDISFGTGGGSGPPTVIGNGTSTPADRSAYFHLNQTRWLLDKWDNANFEQLEGYVNLTTPQLMACNAFSASYMVGFLPQAGNCRNAGEIRDVVAHELGHTWDRFDGNDIAAGLGAGSASEWKGDMMALFTGGDACVGESFRISGGPSTACNGVRDIDEKAAGRTDHVLTPAVCPTCATLKRTSHDCPIGNAPHCYGQIPGQAAWHLLKNLSTGTDYITGAALPAGNPGFSAEQARWLLERLIIAGGAPGQTWDPTEAGVSIYDTMILVDDNDANLANGTPHAAYINAALAHHEIAEAPAVPDAANCSPLLDPAVSATLEADAATGLPSVRLEWTPAGGATNFDVYRNTRAGDAFLPIAQDVAAGPVIDRGVRVGTTYRYLVAAVRKSGCAAMSPGANVVAVAVTPASLRIASRLLTEVPGASDGDGRIEPGERISVQVTLAESGAAAAATAVTAVVTSASDLSPVTSAGPVSFGTVPAGGSSAGAAPFEVFVGPSEPCGGRVHLVLSASGNEGCWQDGLDIPINGTAQCAVSSSAFVEVVADSLSLDDGGDADGIPDNCEPVTVSYLIRNAGTAPSGPASSTVSTSHPGVTFAPQPACAVSGLSAGQTAPCSFSFSLGGAAPAGVPFLIAADSTASPAPHVLPVVLGAEANPAVFSTLSYGFDGSLQGWTGLSFDLSSFRVHSGSHSAHSGSTTVSNICGRLTSPAFLLDPAAPSTLSFRIFADIEPLTDQWYDRANVHIVDVDTGVHTVVIPSSGLIYNASNTNDQIVGLCHIDKEVGWGGGFVGFNLTQFDLSAFAGHRIQVEINYGTDEGDNREGIYVDELTLTNAALAAPDLQPDACLVPEVSSAGAPVPLSVGRLPADVFRFTWEDLGPGFQYNLYAGALGTFYSHGAAPLACSGLGSGVSCNGTSCVLDEAGSALPAGNLYFLVTSSAFGVEGTSGFASNMTPIDPAQSTCAP